MASNGQLDDVCAPDRLISDDGTKFTLSPTNPVASRRDRNLCTRDYTWSPRQPIVFATRRQYATRPPQPSPRTFPASQSSSAAAVSSSHKNPTYNFAVSNPTPAAISFRKLSAEIDELHSTVAELKDLLMKERREHDDKVARMDREQRTEITRLKNAPKIEFEQEKRKLEQERRSSIANAQAAQKVRDDQVLQSKLAAQDDKYRALLKEKVSMDEALHKEKEASANERAKLDQLHLRFAQFQNEISQRHKARESYAGYRTVFEQMSTAWQDVRNELVLSQHKARKRLEADDSFAHDWSKFAESDSWLALTRAALNHTIVQHIEGSRDESQRLLEDTTAALEDATKIMATIHSFGHWSRQATRSLRHRDSLSYYELTSMLNIPSTQLYRKEIYPLAKSASVLRTASRLHDVLVDLQSIQSLQALRSDSVGAKRAFLEVEDLREQYIEARTASLKYLDELTSFESRTKFRNLYKSRQSEMLDDLEEHVELWKKLTLLEHALDEPGVEESKLDERIDAKIAGLQAEVQDFATIEARVGRRERLKRSTSAPASLSLRQTLPQGMRSLDAIESDIAHAITIGVSKPELRKLQTEFKAAKIWVWQEHLRINGSAPSSDQVQMQSHEDELQSHNGAQKDGSASQSLKPEDLATKRHFDLPSTVTLRGETGQKNAETPSRGRTRRSLTRRSASLRSIRGRPVSGSVLPFPSRTTGRSAIPFRRTYSCDARMTRASILARDEFVDDDGSFVLSHDNGNNDSRRQLHLTSSHVNDVSTQPGTGPICRRDSIELELRRIYLNSDHCADSDAVSISSLFGEKSSTDSQFISDNSTAEDMPTSSLSYCIPPEVMQAARQAPSGSAGSFWTYALYRDTAGRKPARHYCKTLKQAEDQAAILLSECSDGDVLGFDLEWVNVLEFPGKSTIKRNVSLIQIANESKCLLFHLAAFVGDSINELMPPSLRKILESPDIIKTGVNVGGDATRLRGNLDVNMQGLIELSHLYKVVKYSETAPEEVNKKLVRMDIQVLDVLQLPLDKTPKVRVGDWTQELSLPQIDYACSDAYAGFQLYHALDAQRRSMTPIPPMPAYQELRVPLLIGNGKPPPKKRTGGVSGTGKDQELDEDEVGEEFFDVVENMQDVEEGGEEHAKISGGIDAVDCPGRHSGSATTYIDTPMEHSCNHSTELSEPIAPEHSTNDSEDPPPISPLQKADEWIKLLRDRLPAQHKLRNGNNKQSTLRAYHLWHEQGHDVKSAAKLLRETPMSTYTVASYVLDAIKEINLPFSFDRIKEPLAVLPPAVRRRYQHIIEQVELRQH